METSNKLIPSLILIGLLVTMVKITLASENKNHIAPMVYVERCSFDFEGKNCGEIAKNVIFLSSEEFLSFTDYWAVGRQGNYKMYLSCLDPKQGRYINGNRTLITVVVAGPGLGKAHEIARQLISEFSSELPENKNNLSHCTAP
ncbi:MAG: hypothetical protein HKP55_10500 [Gammaproteobacteria bacterium]|nr:hypothetical protein [Gammaproteobacteria bacterium]